ncbi:MAG: PKD domain-containing protein [Chloroflexota bacterium]
MSCRTTIGQSAFFRLAQATLMLLLLLTLGQTSITTAQEPAPEPETANESEPVSEPETASEEEPTPEAPTTEEYLNNVLPHNHALHDHSGDDYDLAEQARQRNEPPFQMDAATAARMRAPANLSEDGEWSAPVTWPFAFASASNLPDGRILAWGANNQFSFNGGNFTHASVWDPDTGQFLSRNRTGHPMFCAIPTMMEDGRVFINGGDADSPLTSIYNGDNDTWSSSDTMSTGRWYPGTVMLPNDTIFTILGKPGGPYPEVWTEQNGWSLLTGANLNNGILNFSGYQSTWLPYIHLMPDGNIFHSGPTTQMNILDPTGSGSISDAGLTNSWYPKYSTTVMYDEGKLLVAGGAANDTGTAPGTDQAKIIDFNGPTPTQTSIAPMSNARKFNNGVMLPNGEVMIVGGNTSGIEFSDQGSVLAPEIWNPDTGQWREVAPMSVPRNYHSVALLMTDGRVWSGGGGLCNCSADHPDHQVYSPAYLYNPDGSLATRPVISSAPNLTNNGATMAVSATADIQRFTMIKMSGLTHSLNSDLRFLNVNFNTISSGNYELTMHGNSNVLTPGYWMLFALDSQGVPSIAKTIQIELVDTNVQLTNPGNQLHTLDSSINLAPQVDNPSGNGLTFSATNLPTGLSIDSNSGVISGVVTAAGVYNVTVDVDNSTSSDSVSFTWTVVVPGQVRYVRLVADSEVNGNPWTSAAEFHVIDDTGSNIDRTTWSITADSEELNGENGRATNAIDGNIGTIWHTQWQAANPPHPHEIVVDMGVAYNISGFRYLPRQTGQINGTIADYRFFVSSDGINWGNPVAQGTFANNRDEKTVLFDLNEPPTLTNPGNQTNMEGDSVNLAIGFNDPDGDALNFGASGLPPGLSIDSETAVISGNLSAGSAGNYTVTVTADDGNGGNDSTTFDWQVNAAPALMLNPITSTPQEEGTAVNYTAVSSGGINPRYKWQFGDGTPETAYDPSPTVSHTFTNPGRYLVTVTATDDSGQEVSKQFSQLIHRPLTANPPTVSMSIVYEPANNRVWNVNPDNNTVTVINATTGQKIDEISVGTNPRAIAIAPNGRIWVTNKRDATISIIDPSSLDIDQTVNLPYASQPHGLAFAPDGSAAYVALEATGELLELHATNGNETDSVDVGDNPRHISVSAGSSRIYVSRFITPPVPGEETANPNFNSGGGEVVVVNASNMSVLDQVTLQFSDRPDSEGNGRGLPNYLGPAVISPDGLAAWVPSKQDNIARGTLRDGQNLVHDHTVRSITSYIDLSNTEETFNNRIDHDNGGIASSGQFGRYGAYLFVALEGSREVAVVDAFARTELFRFDVGRAPQGIAVSPDGQTLFVHNFMDRSIGIYDLANLLNDGQHAVSEVDTVDAVDNELLSPQVLQGKQHFYDSDDERLALDGYISCASCHNDGGQDGRTWDMTGFGEGLRNTIDLNGRFGTGHGPVHWTGNFDEIQDFENQIRNLSGGTGLMSNGDFSNTQDPLGPPKAGLSTDLDALAAYVTSLISIPDSPYRNSNGSLSGDAIAGQAVFQSQNCAQCHSGMPFSDSALNNFHDIGTLTSDSGSRLGNPLTGLDTPTLRGVWQTAPYFHDGSAPTLADAISRHNNVSVSGTELLQLVDYLQQLDDNEPAPPTPNQPPTAVFSANPTNGTNPLTVNFDASASSDSDGAITSYAWDFGDGNSDNGATASHTFNSVGNFTVTLTVTDDDGATDSATTTINVTEQLNQPPTAVFSADPTNGTNPLPVNFDASASSDSDGSIASYAWDFGDGNGNSGATASHTFNSVGNFTVSLTVTDDDGAIDSTTTTINVTEQPNQPPTAVFSANPTNGTNPLPVSFDASASSDSDGSISSYAWDFGDGNSDNGETASHTFSSVGNFTVTLTVTDNDGATDSTTATINVSNVPAGPPDCLGGISREYWLNIGGNEIAELTDHPNYPHAPSGSDTMTSFATPIYWNQTYGTRVRGHLYVDVSGDYTFWLAGDDHSELWLSSDDSPDNISRLVHVPGWTFPNQIDKYASQTATVTLTAGQLYYIEGLHKQGSGADHMRLFWQPPGESMAIVPGDHLCPLDELQPPNEPPTAVLNTNITTGGAPLTVSFDGTASSDSDGSISSYSWDFGDGNSDSGATVSHTYNNPGSYTATLTVTDNRGDSDSATVTIVVNEAPNQAPTAVFSANPTNGTAPLTVNLDASASSDSDGSIVSYVWDFGDGNSDNGTTASHTFNTIGSYTITLTVTDDEGATDTTTQTVNVTEQPNDPPTAVISANPPSGNAPLNVTFDGSGSSDSDGTIASYAWDFGNGNSDSGATTSHTYNNIGGFTVTLTVTDNDGTTATATTTISVNSDPGTTPDCLGGISREYWLNISGNDLDNLRDHPNYPNLPSGGDTLDSFATPRYWNQNYGARVRGYLYAEVSGEYTFWLASDDDGELWLSSDNNAANAALIASVSGWTFPDEIDKYSSQVATVTLTAGQLYYIEALHKQGSGADHLTLFWQPPDGSQAVVPGDNLCPLPELVGPNEPPTAVISANPTSGPASLTVNFDATGSSDSDGSIGSYDWDFGDGNSGSGATPSHTYATEGSYTATLTVTDNRGDSDSATVTINVSEAPNQPPTAVFTANTTSGVAPLDVTFDASASSDSDGNIVSYAWDFGDGNSGSGASASHTFANIGTYQVTLTVTDNDGATDNSTVTIIVTDTPIGPPDCIGSVLREYWLNMNSFTIADMMADPRFPDAPTGSELATSFTSPAFWNELYGTRMRGFIYPTVSGNYTFWIASDDHGELWLSSDTNPANATLIASVSGWTFPQEWDKYSSQQSITISLSAGQLYYIEALHKENYGGDHVAVAWQPPGGTRKIIPGEHLCPFDVNGGQGASASEVVPRSLSETLGPNRQQRLFIVR